MNIGLDISQVVYEGTGSARYVDRLMSGLFASEVELTLFGSAWKRRNLLEKYRKPHIKTKLFSFPPAFFELLWNKWHVGNFELFTGNVDVYHSSDWTQAPSKAKKVTTVHDLIPFLYPEYVHPRIREAHEARWKWILKEVDKVVVDAECTKRDIERQFRLSEDRILVVPLGVDDSFLRVGKMNLVGQGIFSSGDAEHSILEKKNTILSNYNLVDNKYILAVGTMEPRKNLTRLVRGYASLQRELRKDYPLVIVGKKSWSEQIAIPEGCEIYFTGYVDDEDLPYLYASAKLFVMPSLYEGFGIPVLEAMACGTAVLASPLASLPEVGGETINYFENVEDVTQIKRDLERVLITDQTELIVKAYERACNMTWENTVKETIKVYNQLI